MIRSVAPGDLWSLRRKPRNQLLLYTEGLLAQPHRPVWFGLRCLIAGNGRERTTLVYRDRGSSAVVQAQGRSGRPEQDILYLASTGARTPRSPSDHDLWFRLIERLCTYAGQSHVQRLYAAIPSAANDVREIFRQAGFQAYANAQILHLSGPDWDQGTTLAAMRMQARRDHWAVHKLYGAVTPHLVQHAEVRNARHWALPLNQPYASRRQVAWVLGPDDDLTAYLRLVSGATGNVLTLLVRPDARDLVVDVLRFGLAQITDSRPVYLVLREYQGELLAPAQGLGFQPIGEQTLLMKSTVQWVRRPLLVPSFEAGLEPQVTVPRISTLREDR
jgi:hypothetical protein